MAQMERVSQVLLSNALTGHGENLQRSLSNAALSLLLAEMDALTRRYPAQDQEESIEVYQQDFEALALKYSLGRVVAAMRELRIRPGQKFFPRPDEVSEEIERMLEVERDARSEQLRLEREARGRQDDIDTFWNEIVPDRMQRFGETETQILARYPSMRGTRPSTTGGNR
jgi:hypothetical protein